MRMCSGTLRHTQWVIRRDRPEGKKSRVFILEVLSRRV
jgi:hypothetical protein